MVRVILSILILVVLLLINVKCEEFFPKPLNLANSKYLTSSGVIDFSKDLDNNGAWTWKRGSIMYHGATVEKKVLDPARLKRIYVWEDNGEQSKKYLNGAWLTPDARQAAFHTCDIRGDTSSSRTTAHTRYMHRVRAKEDMKLIFIKEESDYTKLFESQGKDAFDAMNAEINELKQKKAKDQKTGDGIGGLHFQGTPGHYVTPYITHMCKFWATKNICGWRNAWDEDEAMICTHCVDKLEVIEIGKDTCPTEIMSQFASYPAPVYKPADNKRGGRVQAPRDTETEQVLGDYAKTAFPGGKFHPEHGKEWTGLVAKKASSVKKNGKMLPVWEYENGLKNMIIIANGKHMPITKWFKKFHIYPELSSAKSKLKPARKVGKRRVASKRTKKSGKKSNKGKSLAPKKRKSSQKSGQKTNKKQKLKVK